MLEVKLITSDQHVVIFRQLNMYASISQKDPCVFTTSTVIFLISLFWFYNITKKIQKKINEMILKGRGLVFD